MNDYSLAMPDNLPRTPNKKTPPVSQLRGFLKLRKKGLHQQRIHSLHISRRISR